MRDDDTFKDVTLADGGVVRVWKHGGVALVRVVSADNDIATTREACADLASICAALAAGKWPVEEDTASLPVPPADGGSAPSWWEAQRDWPRFSEDHWVVTPAWFTTVAVEVALRGGPPVHSNRACGTLVDRAGLVERLQTLGFRLVVDAVEDGETAFAHPAGVVRVASSDSGRNAHVGYATNSADLRREIEKAVRAHLAEEARGDRVYALYQRNGRFCVESVGRGGEALVRDNYDPRVLVAYDHVVADIRSPEPCGRLVVLSGIPGSGKTHLVRGLVRDVPEGTFVVVPPTLVPVLGNPDLLPAIQECRDDREGPLVLVCEDGDSCLVQRMADNVADVQAVLNLGDGILGAALDVRVVITTNARKLEMDPAVTRDGRLCRHLTLGMLGVKQANAVLRRLVGDAAVRTYRVAEGYKPDGDVFREPVTLAHVYRRARDLGWSASKGGA